MNWSEKRMKKGKSYAVISWYAHKIQDSVSAPCSECDVFAVMEEKRDEVYVFLSLSVNIHKCMWLKKEYLTEYDVGLQPDGTWRYETIFEKDYKKCLEKFASFWQQFM